MCATSRSVRAPRTSKRRLLRSIARLINYDLFDVILHEDPPRTGKNESHSSPAPVVPAQERRIPAEVAPQSRELPPVKELYRLFDLYNAIHFENTLPPATVEYSTRMLSAGSCEPLRRRIKIGVRYHQVFREELVDTLKHEMIHLVHYRHDKHFKAKAAEMGVPVHARFHPDLRRPPRFLYQCPVCRTQYPRQRRLRETSCGLCSGDAYDSRFKLRLARNCAST